MRYVRLVRYPVLLIVVVMLVQSFRVMSLAPELDHVPEGPVNDLLGTLPTFAIAWGGWRVVRSGRGLGAAAVAGVLLSAIVWVLMTIGWLASGDAPPPSVVALVVAKSSLMYLPMAAATGAVGGLVARLVRPNVHAQPALAGTALARRR
jgi:hypothetical protein